MKKKHNKQTNAVEKPNQLESVENSNVLQPNENVLGEAIAATSVYDAFANPAARLGYGELNLMNATEYPLTRLSQDWSLLTSLYRSSWIVQRVCNVIPEDALTDLRLDAPGLNSDAISKLDETLRRTKIRSRIIEALRWARLYGGAAAIMMVDDDSDLSEPLDVDYLRPKCFRGLYVVDRWSGIYPSTELVDNMRHADFGLPRYYEVRDEAGVIRYTVHHSRVLRFIGTELPFYERIAEQYWGASSIEAMYDDLVRRDNVTHNIANLTFRSNLSVYQIENLDQIFATAGSAAQRRMYSMLQAMSILESNLGVRLVNKGDDIQQLQYSFSGLPEVLDGAMLDVSGATSIPATRLFGRSPAGMNSTGESDEKNYRGILEQQRSANIIPALEKLAPVVCMSALGGVPAGAEFKLPDLNEMTPEQKSAIVDQRSQTLERLFVAGILPADAVLEGIRTAELEAALTSAIKDSHLEKMRGKYQKDVSPQGDPFGGLDVGGGEESDVDGYNADTAGYKGEGDSETDDTQNPKQEIYGEMK